MAARELCRVDQIRDRSARGFVLDVDGREVRVIAVRLGARVRVYRNRCPHRGTPLDWVPDHFMDAAGENLVCATHGARFRPHDGHCIAGPCVGEALQPVATEVRNGGVFVLDA